MEDDKFKSLFSNFDPELSSDTQFMGRLERNLNSVEIIKQHIAESRARNKKAVTIGVVVGFIVGFLFSLSLPYLNSTVSDWQLSLPDASVMKTFADNFTIIAWAVIGSTSVFAALNTYEISLSMLKQTEAAGN